MYVVELEKDVWLRDGNGDPSRTLKIENAKQFKTKDQAEKGLKFARTFRSFVNAEIKTI